MNKDELKKKFSELIGDNDNNNIDCGNCYDCNNCYECGNCYDCIDCRECYDCYHCHDCYNCYDCLLCKNLTNETSGYWLLNEEVSKEEFEAAKEAMGY